MSVKDFTANVISKTPIVPDGNFKDSKASGIWDINEALDLIKGGNWPNAANINPSAFVNALFQTHLYTGVDDTDQTITNGIDLSGSGGLVWIKNRDQNDDHALYDTERGIYKYLESNQTGAETSNTTHLKAFNNNGFTIGVNLQINTNTEEYASWTFRKQPKFFDIVTYTGSGSAKAIDHNLGTTPGMIIVKQTDAARDWAVFHRMFNGGGSAANFWMKLNGNGDLLDDATVWNDTVPTATQFTVGTGDYTNKNNGTYVAYLFAHNNDDGGFGAAGDQDIIKCGNYTGNNSTTGPVIDLGFEPQFVMIKNAGDQNRGWAVQDSMRGMPVGGGGDQRIQWNDNGAEGADQGIAPTPTGFQVESTSTFYNANSHDYIYMAIRRGGMQTPTAGTDVFAIDTQVSQAAPLFDSGFPVDFALTRNVGSSADWAVGTRLIQGKQLNTNNENAETDNGVFNFTFNDGWNSEELSTNSSVYSWMWARARGYFDVVTYSGTGSARTVAHNLGVAPEMMWVKCRSHGGRGWMTYHSGTGATHYLMVNSNDAAIDLDVIWNDTAPTSSVFSVGTGSSVNESGKTYIAYLFATAAGVSKLGSYTANGNAQNIDCGFSGGNGARFVLIKRTDTAGHWFQFDTSRGFVTGDDLNLQLNETNAQENGYDHIDPLEAGFTVAAYGDDSPYVNINGATYLFYAIA